MLSSYTAELSNNEFTFNRYFVFFLRLNYGLIKKGKISRVHAKKAGRRTEVYLHSSLTSALGGGEWSA